MADSLGDRMKEKYEDRYRIKLTRRMPVIIRLDGKSFHSVTKDCIKPFDYVFASTMDATAQALCRGIQGAKCAYIQSDEISILLTDFDKLTTEAWFDYNIQKMVSVSAGMASAYFSCIWNGDKRGIFDSRTFNIPKEEVCNYFIWRQMDWTRNSVEMLARSYFSHNELHKKNQSDMHEMLHNKGINWADLDGRWKNGQFIYKDELGWQTIHAPRFTQDRKVIENHIFKNSELLKE